VSPPRTASRLRDRARQALVAAMSTALALIPLSAPAATFDPELSWRTLTTEHFHIHFHQGEEQLAEEFSQLIEDVYDTMLAELRWTPRRRTQVVLIDRTDQANGYAFTVPYNGIVIYVTAPQADSSLDLYESWSPTIATHELTHVLHIDTNHGLSRAARWVIGRVASTNRLSPLWMIEGQATWQETIHTTGGRGRAPIADMIKRTAVLEDSFPPLGNLEGFQADPPGGNLRYLFGQDLVQFVADHQGRDAWTRWNHGYGSSVPYLLPGKLVFGKGVPRLYREWRDHLHQAYGAQAEAIRAEGLREGEVISTARASCIAPAFSPDGEHLLWSCNDLRTGPAVWRAGGRGEDPEVLIQDQGAGGFTWRSDSAAFVFSASHVVNRFNSWSDIFLYDLESESYTPLTTGARARDPDFSPDGSRLLVVTNRVQDNQLEVLTVDQRQVPLTELHDHTQFSTPRYSPDGQVIAVSAWKQGRRDLWLYSTEGEPVRRLTQDVATDSTPRWSADGRWLYFASDRTGVPNIYAIEVAAERLWQVTNVLTGALHPAVHPDGSLLAYQHYSHDGWDVRLMELDPEQFIDRGQLPRPIWYDSPLAELVEPVDGTAEAHGDPTGWSVDRLHTDQPTVSPGAPCDPWAAGPTLDHHGLPCAPREASLGNIPADPLRHQLQAPGESVDSYAQARAENVFGEEQDYPFTIQAKRYNPLGTMIPRYYLPSVQFSPYPAREPFDFLPFALSASASTGVVDALRRYGWSAALSYRTDASYLGWRAGFTVNRWLPIYSVGARSWATPVGRVPLDIAGPGGRLVSDEFLWQRRVEGWFSVSYPYTYRSSVFARYSIVNRAELFELPRFTDEEALPAKGWIGSLRGGWRYAWSKPTRYSISVEDGRIVSLVGSILHPWLGTWLEQPDGSHEPLTQVQLTGELREYVVNPLIPNHVLAMRVAGGVTLGQTDYFGAYQLGGSFGDSAYYATPDENRMLRGYPLATDIGDMYWLGGLEYRLPIWRMDRGVGALPIYFRYLSASVYADTGNAFTTVEAAGELVDGALGGTGVELRLAGVYGWGMGIIGRAGYAVGWTDGGFALGDPRGFYFQLGGSF